MQLTHTGAAQTIPNAVLTDISWSGTVSIVVGAGQAGPKRFRAMVPLSGLSSNETFGIEIYGPGNTLLAKDQDGHSGIGTRYPTAISRVINVAEGDAFKVQAWHNGGTGVTAFTIPDIGFFEMEDA